MCVYADWMNGTEYQLDLSTPEQTKQVLPLVLNYLTPQVNSFILYKHYDEL